MIDAKELRIGNKIEHNGLYLTVYSVSANGEIWTNGTTFPVKLPKLPNPIPLTPEILEKAGFKEYKDIKNNIHAKHGAAYYINENDSLYVLTRMWHEQPNYSVRIEYTDSPFPQDKDRQYVFAFDIEYLHQLQNLYHALTQTELNIQL